MEMVSGDIHSIENIRNILDENDILTNRDREDAQSEISSVYMPRECRALLKEQVQSVPVRELPKQY